MSITRFIASEFNADRVISHFEVPPHKKGARAAMRFMYRIMKEDLSFQNSNLAERASLTANATIEFLKLCYTLMEDSLDDFFLGAPIEEDALAIAVLCDEYTPHINEPVQSPDGNIREQYDGIEKEMAEQAQFFWEEATSLMARATGPHECGPEALFIAHIMAIKDVYDYESFLNEYDETESQRIINQEIPAIKSFLRMDTALGKRLNDMVHHLQQRVLVNAIASLVLGPKDKKASPPHLTLVPPSPGG